MGNNAFWCFMHHFRGASPEQPSVWHQYRSALLNQFLYCQYTYFHAGGELFD